MKLLSRKLSGSRARWGLGSRTDALEALGRSPHRPFDLLVVGGGITGAGIALDAASRGMSVALVERLDFASGTSSKSSKLVHGGLRYLEQREFGLMREAATERDLMRRLAPHLVEPLAFVLPVSDRFRRAKFGVGLWAYDALASFRNLHVHRYLDGAETEGLVPALPPGKVRGGFLFYDCKTDDVRLVMENLVQARRYGAVVANYCAVRDLAGGASVCRAVVEDTLSGNVFDVSARRVVVAAGVWTDQLEALANSEANPRIHPSKGIHLTFPHGAIPLRDSGAFIPDVERRRMLFVIPWLDVVIVGTTDTAYEGSLEHPAVDDADRAYCLDAVNAIFGLGLSTNDVAGAYAGLRPLIAGKAGPTADLSRRHSVFEMAEGILGITGGKLTTYRRMAKDAVDRIAQELGGTSRCRTRWIRLGSSHLGALSSAVGRRSQRLGMPSESAANLVRCFGDRALDVLAIAEHEGSVDPIVPGHAPLAAEIAYCARYEMAVHLGDLLARRTRLALTDPEGGLGRGSLAVRAMGAEHGWKRAERRRQAQAFRADLARERGLPLDEIPAAPPDEPQVSAG